jgi:hypothetical protein
MKLDLSTITVGLFYVVLDPLIYLFSECLTFGKNRVNDKNCIAFSSVELNRLTGENMQ